MTVAVMPTTVTSGKGKKTVNSLKWFIKPKEKGSHAQMVDPSEVQQVEYDALEQKTKLKLFDGTW